MSESKSLRAAYGETLIKLGESNKDILVLDADLGLVTMTCLFAKKFPDQFYNFGIAEANMVCAAAGLAFEGYIPFVSTITIFGAGRAFEQIRNSVAYTNANVKFALTHSGISVGENGGSHQAVEDIALMRSIPGMTVFVPCDPLEVEKAIKAAVEIKGPVFIRVASNVCPYITAENDPFIPGKANIMKNGSQISIFCTGLMVGESLEAAKLLEKEGISAGVVNYHTIKPFDRETALEQAKKTGVVLTVEDHSIVGGLGSATAEVLAGKGEFKFERLGIMDKFGKSGTPKDLFREFGLNAENIAEVCKKLLKN